jgi:hypothetical protein
MANEPIVFEEEWDGIRCLRILWHPDDEPWWESWEREGINGWGKPKPEFSGRLPKLEVVTEKRRWWSGSSVASGGCLTAAKRGARDPRLVSVALILLKKPPCVSSMSPREASLLRL